MAELFELNCPHCDRVYRLSRERIEQNVGREIRCRQCNDVFVLPALETAEDAEPAVPLATLGDLPAATSPDPAALPTIDAAPADAASVDAVPADASAVDGSDGSAVEVAEPVLDPPADPEPLLDAPADGAEADPPALEAAAAPDRPAIARPASDGYLVRDVQQHRLDSPTRRPRSAPEAADEPAATPAASPDGAGSPIEPLAPRDEAARSRPLPTPAVDRGIADAFAMPYSPLRADAARRDGPARPVEPPTPPQLADAMPAPAPEPVAEPVAAAVAHRADPSPPAADPALPTQAARDLAAIRRWLVTLVLAVLALTVVQSLSLWLTWHGR
jgi:predicted Zn finger-like uncharacterized protein